MRHRRDCGGGHDLAARTLGGVRNWDYRYCWLRDATFTLLALMHLGYYDEARGVAGLAGSGRRRQPAADSNHVWGRRRAMAAGIDRALAAGLREFFAGADRKRGHEQLQLDVFGETADAMFQGLKSGMVPSERGRALQPVIAEYLATAWRQPDEGIWEVRGGRQHFVHSKVMAWVAFDRAAHRCRKRAYMTWRAAGAIADEIYAEVCARGLRSGPQQLRAGLRLQATRRKPAARPAGRLSSGQPIRGFRERFARSRSIC